LHNSKNKIILLIITDGNFTGGAEKRYLALFDFICSVRKDYYLVLNKKLYLSLRENKVLKSYENVRVMSLYREKNLKEKSDRENSAKDKPIKNDPEKISKIRLLLGKQKMFLKSILLWITFALEFRKVIKELKSDIVYTVWTGGKFAWPLRNIYKFKLVYSYNDSTVEMTSKHFLDMFNYSDHWALKNSDKIDFLSPGIVELFENKIGKLDTNRVTVTPNSFIDYTKYYSDKQKENNVIFLSRLMQNKNPILFLEAVKLFNERYPISSQINFYIFGEGGLEENIREYILNNNLTNTYFEGKTFEPWKYMRKSKVYVSIQQVNNYPSQSLIEAMACENAIIASDVGETRLLVTENEGILVDLTPESIAEAIYELFSTDGLIEKLGVNARKKVIENHTVEKFADYFYSITS
jgi:glycosyltransferase involved in cell wall biosynthesis